MQYNAPQDQHLPMAGYSYGPQTVVVQQPRRKTCLYGTSLFTVLMLAMFVIMIVIINHKAESNCIFNFDAGACGNVITLTYLMLAFLILGVGSCCFCGCLVCGYAFAS